MPAARIALVAGAGGSLGRAIAVRLAARVPVALTDLDADALEQTRRVVQADGGDVVGLHPGDLSDADTCAGVFDALPEPPTELAVAVGTTSGASLHEVTDQQWSATLGSCLTTVFQLLRVATTRMAPGGAVCVLGSVHADQTVPGFPAYAAAKAGVAALVRQASAEYGPRGLRFNLVTPGWTETPHTLGRTTPDDGRWLLEATALRRRTQAEDVAAAVDFLLGPDARAITGADLVVDAGAATLPAASLLRTDHRARLGLPTLPTTPEV